jgi:hypothetical protein
MSERESEINRAEATTYLRCGERDLWPTLASSVREEAERLRSDPDLEPLPPFLRSTSLGEMESEAAYLDRALDLLRRKSHVDTRDYPIPHRPGWVGNIQGQVRTFLWKLMRYQHDRMAFRHNLIHSQTVSMLEFERDSVKRELADLKERVATLEQRQE